MKRNQLKDVFDRGVWNGDCLEYSGGLNHKGYGHFSYQNKMIRANRAAYCAHHEITLESIAGRKICHTCDNPRCINPNHLFIGTAKDNTQDSIIKGRFRGAGQPRGRNHCAKLTQQQVDAIRSDTRSQQLIADEYNISRSTVSMIKGGKRW